MQNKKHAYLLIAHNNFDQLQKLLALLDDPRNDIYLHVDQKATTFDPHRIKMDHSGLFLIDRICVNWGGHSLIECELNLFRASSKKKYQYYHIISGVDLPLKTQDDIHEFFDRNYPRNYISFDSYANESENYHFRTRYFYFFQDYIGRNKGFLIEVLRQIERVSLFIQKKIGVKRKNLIPLYKGTNWVSITDDLVQYILQQEQLIRKQFYYSICGDEIFLQSVAMDSPYKDTIVDDSLRAIDWDRGSPYIYKMEDVDQLLSSECLFGRKFDVNIDGNAIDKIVAYLNSAGVKS